MKPILLIALFSFSFHALPGALPPENTRLVTEKGDLNSDGLEDIVIISRKGAEGDGVLALGIYFGEKSGPREILQSDTILCGDCGSIKSGPNPYSIAIKKNVLHLTFFGGSRFIEERRTKWRLENGKFRLIGFTWEETDSVGEPKIRSITRDTNFLTGETIETATEKKGKVSQKCRRKIQTVLLENFQESAFPVPGCTDRKLAL